jgi:hypothetical protein
VSDRADDQPVHIPRSHWISEYRRLRSQPWVVSSWYQVSSTYLILDT